MKNKKNAPLGVADRTGRGTKSQQKILCPAAIIPQGKGKHNGEEA
nr:MAG TPA: hypothetical protein [Caudoviricetes sp.]